MSNRETIITAVEEGLVDWETVARVAINWLSDHECSEMLEHDELTHITESNDNEES